MSKRTIFRTRNENKARALAAFLRCYADCNARVATSNTQYCVLAPSYMDRAVLKDGVEMFQEQYRSFV